MNAPAIKAVDPDARWAAVFAHVIGGREGLGRFTDDPHDRGGPTKDGITLRFLASECRLDPQLVADLKIGHDGLVTVGDLQGLTTEQAQGVYAAAFWRPWVCRLPLHLDAAVFDQAVNDGHTPAVELLQRALNTVAPSGAARLPIDGQIGPATLTRATQAEQGFPGVALRAMRTFAAARYRAIVKSDPSQSKYLDGWLSRAEHLGDV